MTLLINGEKRTGIRAGTVSELVVELGLPSPACLVELNGVALRRAEWELAVLGEGDVLEIIRIVAGG
jgi:sulfur carrier protein